MAAKRKGAAVAIARLREMVEARLEAIQEEIVREREGLAAIDKHFDMKEAHAMARTLREVIELERRERQIRERRAKQRKAVSDVRRHKLVERILALGRGGSARRSSVADRPPDGGAEG